MDLLKLEKFPRYRFEPTPPPQPDSILENARNSALDLARPVLCMP